MSIPRSLRARAKQTRLAFSPLPSSSPAKDQCSNAIQDRLANVRHTGTRRTSESTPLIEPEIKHELPPTPEPSSQIKAIRQCSDADDSDEIAPPSSKRRRIVGGRKDGQDQDTPMRKTSARLISGADPVPPSHDTSTRGYSVLSEILSELGEPESTGDEEDALVTKPAQRRQRKKAGEDPFVVDDDRIDYISSDDEPRPKSKSRSRRTNQDDWLAPDDEVEYVTSDEEVVAATFASSRMKSKKDFAKARRRRRQEQEELQDDLADLRDSDHSEDAVNTPRTRGGPVTTQRDKTRQHFELLKRRRAGEKVPLTLDSDEEPGEEEEEEEQEPVDIDSVGRGDGFLGAPHEISDDSSAHEGTIAEDRPEDDNFVVDDAVSRRLRLPHPDIPLQFTSYATAKPKDLFIHVIEWLVKNRIAPAFSRDDPIYKLALSKVSDQVTAQAGSRLISSAWSSDFKYAILARPNISITYLDELEDGDDVIRTCDACNRANHPARYDFVLGGEPYRKCDLENVDDDDKSDDEDTEKEEYDEAGHLLPSQAAHFYLGRFCAANAEMGHKLMHWQYHLNQELLDYLEEQGVFSVDATLARDRLNRKKREKEAEAIVDSMDETGVIRSLWSNFRSDLEDARLGMEDFERKGKRGQSRIGTIRSTSNGGLIREWNNDRMTVSRARSESDDDED